MDRQLIEFLLSLPWIAAIGLLLAAWLADLLVRGVLLRIAARMAAASPMRWDDAIARRKVLSRLAHVVPAVVILAGVGFVRGLPELVYLVVRNVAWAYIALPAALALGNLFDAFNDLYETSSEERRFGEECGITCN